MIVYCNGKAVADKVSMADSFGSRLLGLMGRKDMADGEGLFLMNCPSIHCFFMRITVDVFYLSKDLIVIDKETLAPWKIGKMVKGAVHVLEFPENYIGDRMNIGDQISIDRD